MIKKIFILTLLCVILLSITGCAEYIVSSSPTGGVSSVLPTQPPTIESTAPTILTQPTEGQSEISPTQSTTIESTAPTTLTQPTEGQSEISPTQSTTIVPTAPTTLTQPTEGQSEFLPTQSTTMEPTAPTTPTQSTEGQSEISPTQSTTIVPTAPTTLTQPTEVPSKPPLTQPTTITATNPLTPTQSTEVPSKPPLTQSTTIEPIAPTTPTQPTEAPSKPPLTQPTTIEPTVPTTPIISEKPTDPGDVNMDDACTLIVKGKEIAATNHIKLNYEYRYAELPLTAIMKELGAKVEWESKTTAKITFDETDFFLDAEKGSLVKAGNTLNILTPAPGSKHGAFYQVVDDEFIIDSDSAKMLLINIMGTKISIDYDDRIVNIS